MKQAYVILCSGVSPLLRLMSVSREPRLRRNSVGRRRDLGVTVLYKEEVAIGAALNGN